MTEIGSDNLIMLVIVGQFILSAILALGIIWRLLKDGDAEQARIEANKFFDSVDEFARSTTKIKLDDVLAQLGRDIANAIIDNMPKPEPEPPAEDAPIIEDKPDA